MPAKLVEVSDEVVPGKEEQPGLLVEPVDVILREFPSLKEDDVRAVIAFAAASASEDLPAPSPMPPETKVA